MSRRWHVSMTFEGYAEGEVSHAAAQEFKRSLGLAPEAMRSEIHMTGMRVREVDADYNPADDIERTQSQR